MPADPSERSIIEDLEAGESPLSMNGARRDARLTVDGRAHDLSWIFRATSRGIGGIVLESTKIGGSRITTNSSIARFIARQAAPHTSTQKSQASHRAHEQAEARLVALGL